MNQPNLRKFRANIDDFKCCCTIDRAEFYLFDKVARNLARQYAKKLFGRYGDVASLREGLHGLPPQRYWSYEGYVSKSDKFGRFLEGRCFVPEANLVVTGKIRLGREICTIGIWITSVITVVSLPAPVTAEIEAPAEIEVVAEVEAPKTAIQQKRTARSKKAKAELAPVQLEKMPTISRGYLFQHRRQWLEQRRSQISSQNGDWDAGELIFYRVEPDLIGGIKPLVIQY